jgi:hypothetical protein
LDLRCGCCGGQYGRAGNVMTFIHEQHLP